ncbi:hypothetical protein ANCCAN_10512 [Ancylostoma caninum]|uniref:Uncharacterized protein n=1 Tax=Ancylostoma caninum TaxID=29170 RepID=A0A368GGJ1_ANCCA|nr:hypothetical protein ANCCAN_10512 [Ancylostoma caninum]
MLQGLGLGQPELEMSAEDLKMRPTEFWYQLGPMDRVRGQSLQYRKACRMSWGPQIRVAISQALADVRQYRIVGGKLRPKPKRRRIVCVDDEADDNNNNVEQEL